MDDKTTSIFKYMGKKDTAKKVVDFDVLIDPKTKKFEKLFILFIPGDP